VIKAQMDVLHAWSRERGHLMQAIAGIPYYYRRFGCEMAVSDAPFLADPAGETHKSSSRPSSPNAPPTCSPSVSI
jgi:hypothetical protein